PKKIPASHSGQWFYEEKSHKAGLLLEDGPFLQENVHKAVSDFCNWVATLISYLDEELVLKQFDINDQSKPRSDVLCTLRLDQVPRELKYNVGPRALQKPEFFRKPDYDRKPQKPQNPDKTKGVKMKYRAWYLDTKLWKKQSADDPLVDPKVSRKAQDENFKEELQKQEEFLADLHGTVAFKDFILHRGYRMPSLVKVAPAAIPTWNGTPPWQITQNQSG
ncbi:protein FAM47E-like, partial [Carlito syrichta]|uniref:Protein FAM47E-like n=1 Tax=Carlito syrichta TaxID=1868482 RepID=A0A1U7SR88_CARSF